MKFFAVALLLAALIAVVLGGTAPIPNDLGRCNYICQKSDVSVCATNGICLNRFKSLCELQIYNCINPQKQFQQVKDHKCNESWQPICTKGDFQ